MEWIRWIDDRTNRKTVWHATDEHRGMTVCGEPVLGHHGTEIVHQLPANFKLCRHLACRQIGDETFKQWHKNTKGNGDETIVEMKGRA